MTQPRPNPWLIALAFAAVYIIWGSTFLAIRWAIEGLPPFFMAGTRHLIAGVLLGGWLLVRAERLPTARQWGNALILGSLMLACSNGLVTWSEQHVPSGVAAVLCASVAMWMVVLSMLIAGPGGVRAPRPRPAVIVGLVMGIAGVVLLVGGQSGRLSGLGAGWMPKVAAGALVFAGFSWSLGSLLSRRMDRPSSLFMAAAAQMVMGGLVLIAVSGASGEFVEISLARVTWRAALSHAYLAIFGSIVGFTAYTWLLRVVSPARVATYAYVNPVVAVVFGWALGGERVSGMTLLAAAVIVAGVAMIVTGSRGNGGTDRR